MEDKRYISQDFLLTNNFAKRLYHEVAADKPIVDFHNHLSPKSIADDVSASNIASLWVMADQYKHRAMRINGIPEYGITGNATELEKFQNWAKTVPYTLGNPLHQWTHLELARVFGIDKMLNENTADEIWNECNSQLKTGNLSTVKLLKKFNTETICTSDDLLDDVQIQVQASKHGVNVLPSLRTDSIIPNNETFLTWLQKLSDITKIEIIDLTSFEIALRIRFEIFDQAGCVLADQALDAGFIFERIDESKAAKSFEIFLSNKSISHSELFNLQGVVLVLVGKLCREFNWGLQLHIGAQRSTSSKLSKLLGTAGGYAAIGQSTDISSLVAFLNAIEEKAGLPKIILYNLNPADNAAFASLTGSFAESGVLTKIQFGPAWWYNDHYSGIISQLEALSSFSLLARSIGMTTDSRSFLSLSRHEYFRRIFCEFIAQWVHKGLLPNDFDTLARLVNDVVYTNAKNWLQK